MEAQVEPAEIPLNEFCIIKQTQGKGYGVFATRNIPQGTRILADPPMLKLPGAVMEHAKLTKADIEALAATISTKLKALSKEQQREFFSLANTQRAQFGVFLGIAATNAMLIDFETTEYGIFPKVSRFNHGCRPNSMRSYHPVLDQAVVHVVKDVSEGEEITVSYVEPGLAFYLRQEQLKEKFGFICGCNLCLMPENERRLSDMRLTTIMLLFNSIRDDSVILDQPLASLHNTHTAMLLQKEEGILEVLAATFYYDAVMITMAHGDHARTRVFAEMAKEAAIASYGVDHPITMGTQALADDPVGFGIQVKSTMWKHSVDEIPVELDDEAFNSWLWKLEE
ncbi:uncharacterized protein CIMG_04672 [Coccidioides immitis RS]|uniref:SET domain-containing protein n=7 Tax=Coccidioides TaxID=5500 RepID=J3KDZ3_COCIM|nr:uncharacterized protein CIMG_04672 [Coccidioides immitis RS]XP_003071608.1 hypothetical protein CPC735_071450 [Coccidioides posadasii C735 delta SOWgp]EFW13261.1 conserved hypothetical protein [Coccidioides posadasii str. Silveira]KMM70168.1 hypothetical protein CPAG_06481 [Coccidioides posadasii RMSCC 3488]TPX21315.1 hypothetical protein DIZ76_015271 [Coccidioides immitis]EAS33648.3 hypothetical protein CIMG_04672 [Coccidioides immitis RS]EER29463.1 hypothetical protein CPC735_071450 [Coc|eukprot:XP_003071608.1 hypothetical protein CPC735_071450 [Coccidioides posadasii C735 delta SOWgp]